MEKRLTKEEQAVLQEMKNCKRYPLVRLELHSTKQPEAVSTALNHVHLTRVDEAMEVLKERGQALASLQESGLVSVEYGVACWVRGDFDLYCQSDICKYFCRTVEEAAGIPGALFDQPCLCRGYSVLTCKGRQLVSSMEK